ncbi:MAG: hypothetical protein CMD43_04270 [Gammaproteobacteria bacterium]|nr:hypothetical protein [Gammaproteobacteria bacterium]|tara:strand:+ start:9589 stop:10719 length:1131 start_codon:yes stop_codon:yes gene_type:complete
MVLLSGPNLSGNELKYIKDCIDTGWVSSVGSYVTDLENSVSKYVGSKYAVAMSSGTTALHLSLKILNIRKDDYVIAPNLTFIATLNAIKYTNANPILIDVDEKSWQMNLDLLEKFLNNKTRQVNGKCTYKEDGKIIKAIVAVHVLGNMCDMLRLVKICEAYNILLIEDAAESLGSKFKGKHSGTFGNVGCFSFNGNKIITCGGGGMIVTNDENIAKKAKHLSTQAKADSFEYFHDEIGYNYRLTNVSAAIGLAQMEQLDKFIKNKHYIKDFYINSFRNIGDITFQAINDDVFSNWWLFTIRSKKQKSLLESLNKNKLQSRPFWIPMNNLPMFKEDLYVTEENISNLIYKSALSIPCSTNINQEELLRVVECIKKEF